MANYLKWEVYLKTCKKGNLHKDKYYISLASHSSKWSYNVNMPGMPTGPKWANQCTLWPYNTCHD